MTPIKASNITRHELIGLDAKVEEDSNLNNLSISGEVVDETREILVIREKGKDKRIAKRNAVFIFLTPQCETIRVEGSTILGRPEDRVKKKIKRKW